MESGCFSIFRDGKTVKTITLGRALLHSKWKKRRGEMSLFRNTWLIEEKNTKKSILVTHHVCSDKFNDYIKPIILNIFIQ